MLRATASAVAVFALMSCNQAAKPADSHHHEPAVGQVMATPEQAPKAAPSAAPGTEPSTAPSAAPSAAKPALPVGKVYGAGVTMAETVQVSDLHARVDELVGKRVRVQGQVLDVCPMRGCWFELAGDKPGSTLRFKVRDGTMVFPLSAKGKHAVAEGVVRKIPLNLEQTRRVLAHEAEEKGEPFDPTSVTAAITLVRLDGVGAVIGDAR